MRLICCRRKAAIWVCKVLLICGFLKVDLAQADNISVAAGDYLVIDLSGGPSATNYPVAHLASIPVSGWTDEYRTTKLVMRKIPAGTFTMGSFSGELGRESDERQHQVTLSKGFYIGVFEVTQMQWERVMGNWPGYFYNRFFRESRPVENVSYDDIRGTNAGAKWPSSSNVDVDSFMGKLQARTGKAFDLPTEAQWEYACRAGTLTSLNSGCDITNSTSDAQMSCVGRYWHNGGKFFPEQAEVFDDTGTAKVGSYQSNAWGLYDMHGNVWEWCLDWWGCDYLSAKIDPKGVAKDERRGMRGGAYGSGAKECRSANRCGTMPSNAWQFSGFRIVVPFGHE